MAAPWSAGLSPAEPALSWRFVTSGLSNAWEVDEPDATGWSGLGIELVLEVPTNAAWALNVVAHLLAYQLLLSIGRFGDARVIEPYARIPLNGPIDGQQSDLTYLIVCPAHAAPEDLQLESGQFSLVQLVGATEAEIDFARRHSGTELLARLTASGAYPITDPKRASVI